MSIATAWTQITRIQIVIDELKRLIREQYPEATFAVEVGGEPDGVYLVTTVDLEDTEEVLDVIMDRLLEIQIDEQLPVYVLPVRPEASKHESFARKRVTSDETSRL